MNNKKINFVKSGSVPILYLWLSFAVISAFALLSPFMGIESLNDVKAKLLSPFAIIAMTTVACILIHLYRHLSQSVLSLKIFSTLLVINVIYTAIWYLTTFKVFDVFAVASIAILAYILTTILKETHPQNTQQASVKISAGNSSKG